MSNEQNYSLDFIKNKHAIKLLRLTLLLWLCFIWIHSAIPASGSSEESRIVGNIIRPVLELILGKGGMTDHIVRKLAHFTEYTVLGLLMGANVGALTAQIGSRMHISRRISFFCWSYGLLLTMAAALIDESIQIFSPGRSPQVTDVLLDTAGSVVGLLAFFFILHCYTGIGTFMITTRGQSE